MVLQGAELCNISLKGALGFCREIGHVFPLQDPHPAFSFLLATFSFRVNSQHSTAFISAFFPGTIQEKGAYCRRGKEGEIEGGWEG